MSPMCIYDYSVTLHQLETEKEEAREERMGKEIEMSTVLKVTS